MSFSTSPSYSYFVSHRSLVRPKVTHSGIAVHYWLTTNRRRLVGKIPDLIALELSLRMALSI